MDSGRVYFLALIALVGLGCAPNLVVVELRAFRVMSDEQQQELDEMIAARCPDGHPCESPATPLERRLGYCEAYGGYIDDLREGPRW